MERTLDYICDSMKRISRANGQLKVIIVLMGAAIIFQGNKIKKLEAAVKER